MANESLTPANKPPLEALSQRLEELGAACSGHAVTHGRCRTSVDGCASSAPASSPAPPTTTLRASARTHKPGRRSGRGCSGWRSTCSRS
jgi:hypothetical protein